MGEGAAVPGREVAATPPSPPRAEPVEHGCDPIEQLFAGLDVACGDVASGDRDAQVGARLVVGARRGGEPRDSMAALAAVAFGDVERDGAERGSKLFAEIAILLPDARDNGAKSLDGVDRELEDLKRGRVMGRTCF